MSRKYLVIFTAISTVMWIAVGLSAAIATMGFLSGAVKLREKD